MSCSREVSSSRKVSAVLVRKLLHLLQLLQVCWNVTYKFESYKDLSQKVERAGAILRKVDLAHNAQLSQHVVLVREIELTERHLLWLQLVLPVWHLATNRVYLHLRHLRMSSIARFWKWCRPFWRVERGVTANIVASTVFVLFLP